jgi:fatty acid desaturase
MIHPDSKRKAVRPEPPAWFAAVRDFLGGLFDLQFRKLLTPRMLPTLFMAAIAASAWAVLVYAAQGFAQSLGDGLLRLLVVGPVAFLALVTLARILLELCLAVFRIAVHASRMAGHTEDIASGLPRIQFWKPARRKGADRLEDE